MRVILLPHPGGERGPAGQSRHVPWPKDGTPHRRKFMRVTGSFVEGTRSETDTLYGWMEYEAPTIAIARHDSRYLGFPRYTQQMDARVERGWGKLNTDPWIFLPGFVWTVCRHNSLNGRLPTPGDIVLFGSSMRGRWLLDTVFVVGGPCLHPPCPDDDAFNRLVAEPLKEARLRPFFGKPYASRDEPFSFVPASRKGPFARPRIDDLLPGLSRDCGLSPSPNNSQALTWTTPRNDPNRFWRDLMAVVEDHGLVLGLGMVAPAHVGTRGLKPLGPRGQTCAEGARPCFDTGERQCHATDDAPPHSSTDAADLALAQVRPTIVSTPVGCRQP